MPTQLAEHMARKRRNVQTSGFLNIDKPPGWTSHDVVARVRRIVGERQVGHAGTLDPAATGVLPVAVGHATRMLPYIEDSAKAYVATIRFGVETDSGDRDGRLLASKSTGHLTEDTVRKVLVAFEGAQRQQPPRQSAIKVGGERLHRLARQGIDVDVPFRDVYIEACELVAWDAPEAVVRVSCSKGTYIRSIARDAGSRLGCGAMLSNLVRVAAGEFRLSDSVSIHDLAAVLSRYGWEWIALHPDHALTGTRVVMLERHELKGWFNGQVIPRVVPTSGDVRVYTRDGTWLGVGHAEPEAGTLQPRRVIASTGDAVTSR